MVWVSFLVCLGIVLFAGTKAARYADIIAEKTGLGRIWIGMLLLSVVTSMPELITSVSAAALVKVPDLSLGTLLGSCIFNLSIIAVLDIFSRGTPVLSRVSQSHVFGAVMGIILAGIVGASILIGDSITALNIGILGLPSIALILVYLIGTRILFLREKRASEAKDAKHQEEPLLYAGTRISVIWAKFSIAAIAIIGSGIWLSYIGDEISMVTGWGTTFVGSMLLAITTSMPELVVALAALKIGGVELSVANILGANMLDITYIGIMDFLYNEAPILSSVSSSHLITIGLLIGMDLVVIAGLKLPAKKKTFRIVSWYSIFILGMYIYGAWGLFNAI